MMKCDICGVESDSLSFAMWLGIGVCRGEACKTEAKRRRKELEDEIFAEPFRLQETRTATDVKHMFVRFGRAIMDSLPDGALDGPGINPMARSPFWWGQTAEERVIPLVPEQYLSVRTDRTMLATGEFEIVQPIPARVWKRAFAAAGMIEGE
jgi:hypothetical protein